MPRINLKGTTLDALIVMSEGNPGAAVALSELLKNDDEGGLSLILWLDQWGIYGTDIYVLYSDICRKDVKKMAAVIRATRYRKFDHKLLAEAAHRQDYSGRELVPVDELCLLNF